MLVLWQLKDFDVDTHNLDERLLTDSIYWSNNKGGFQSEL